MNITRPRFKSIFTLAALAFATVAASAASETMRVTRISAAQIDLVTKGGKAASMRGDWRENFIVGDPVYSDVDSDGKAFLAGVSPSYTAVQVCAHEAGGLPATTKVFKVESTTIRQIVLAQTGCWVRFGIGGKDGYANGAVIFSRTVDVMDVSNLYRVAVNAQPTGVVVLRTFSKIYGLAGLRVGFVGVLTRDTARLCPHADGVTFTDEATALRDGAAALRRAGADLVVAMTHQDLEADIRMARSVPGIDLVLGGHDHEPTEMQNAPGVPVLKSASDARWLAVAVLRVARPDPAAGRGDQVAGGGGHQTGLALQRDGEVILRVRRGRHVDGSVRGVVEAGHRDPAHAGALLAPGGVVGPDGPQRRVSGVEDLLGGGVDVGRGECGCRERRVVLGG